MKVAVVVAALLFSGCIGGLPGLGTDDDSLALAFPVGSPIWHAGDRWTYEDTGPLGTSTWSLIALNTISCPSDCKGVVEYRGHAEGVADSTFSIIDPETKNLLRPGLPFPLTEGKSGRVGAGGEFADVTVERVEAWDGPDGPVRVVVSSFRQVSRGSTTSQDIVSEGTLAYAPSLANIVWMQATTMYQGSSLSSSTVLTSFEPSA